MSVGTTFYIDGRYQCPVAAFGWGNKRPTENKDRAFFSVIQSAPSLADMRLSCSCLDELTRQFLLCAASVFSVSLW